MFAIIFHAWFDPDQTYAAPTPPRLQYWWVKQRLPEEQASCQGMQNT